MLPFVLSFDPSAVSKKVPHLSFAIGPAESTAAVMVKEVVPAVAETVYIGFAVWPRGMFCNPLGKVDVKLSFEE